MTGPARISGQGASAGFARGPVHLARRGGRSYIAKSTPEQELQALHLAVETAATVIASAMGQVSGDAADILEFQLAMLEDGSFTEAAAGIISSGATAPVAWTVVLDAEIAGYQASEDASFAARSADLADIRDNVLSALSGDSAATIPPGVIHVDEDIAPTRFLAHDWSTGGGLVLRRGSVASHVAMLARARGVPMIVGIGDGAIADAAEALLDGQAGELLVSPDPVQIAAFNDRRSLSQALQRDADAVASDPAVTRDGETVAVLVNIADPDDVDRIPIVHVDGVGLMRTEFLFGGERGLPDEDTQLAAYRKVLAWAEGKPVTIRTLDAGGDKPVAGYTIPEDNPFLGMRGIRLSLARPEVFRVQIRALLRAAPYGALKVMLPMVSIPGEIAQAQAMFAEEAADLAGAGVIHRMPEIGIMVEVPSVAVTPDRFAGAAFFSIGSNDLTQYVLAASRDNTRLGALGSIDDPAVLRLIANVTRFGAENGVETSLCGDAASDPEMTSVLLGAGLRRLSVAPARVAVVKAAVRRFVRGEQPG
ncbi:phosphoenolpyruvate-protein phosphotransferase [Hoeflea sp. BAL378]|uniref:phosphoenolpyruvate--protein phosphotransferase n=1 Tax=Hoeflea sp. BAL378 TaxID=1547437 RepID=UPI000513F5F3|nr:phosphoenolpyruvate--protein phosphotransferase [Hoeflea sp. BAL378]KGF68990.1 phosphoenolpyruvate-protein phosphotransferase [Hoeflea sp. BAL378]